MKTKSGRILTDDDLDRLATKADEGLDLSAWQPRRGRPSLGTTVGEHSPRIAVRIPAELHDRAKQRAARQGKNISEVVRTLLEEYAPAPTAREARTGRRSSEPVRRSRP